MMHYALRARGCAPHGSWDGHFFIGQTKDNREVLEAIPKKGECQRVRVKITAAPVADQPARWGAVLLGVGNKFRTPNPVPNP